MSNRRASGRTTASKGGARPGERFVGTVRYLAPLFTPTGYGDESRGFVKSLRRLGYPVRIEPVQTVRSFAELVAADDPQFFRDAVASMSEEVLSPAVGIVHLSAAAKLGPLKDANYTIVRTMFETDGLHPSIVTNLNAVDEIWVPSRFNASSFRDAGVERPIHVLGAGVDARRFRPGIEPLPIPGRRAAAFLSMFEWSERKGWDVLLRAWARAFGPDDDVCLVLRVYPPNRFEDGPELERAAAELLERGLATLGLDRARLAPILTIGRHLPPGQVPRLFAAAQCYVAPSRGEGWGRPQHEAMASGLPVIATAWSGSLEFLTPENALLLEVEGLVPVPERPELVHYAGQRWAEPSTEHLATLLARIAEDPALRRSLGARARSDVESRWQWSQVARRAGERLLAVLEEQGSRAPQRGALEKPAAPSQQIPVAAPVHAPTPEEQAAPSLLLATAEEVLADGSLLSCYAAAFTAGSPVTLVVHGPGFSREELEARLRARAAATGLDLDAGARILALALPSDEGAEALADQALAQLTHRPAAGALARVPVVAPGDPGRLRAHVEQLRSRRVPPHLGAAATGGLRVATEELPEARVLGLFEAAVGLGEAGRRMLAAMEAAEIVCATVPVHMPGVEHSVPFAHRTRPERSDAVMVTCVNAEVLLQLVAANGPGVLAGRYRIGLWHWELECFPSALLPAVDLLDEIWVSSEHTRRTIQAVTNRPVVVMPMPITHRTTPLHTRGDLGLPAGFAFGFSFDFRSLSDRKNPEGLVRAFCEAFAPGEGPQLAIKCTGGDFRPWDRERLLAAVRGRPDITVIDKHFSNEEQRSFIGLVDCYVSLHRAEGFGLTLAEAMAWGKPVVATGWSGNLDFMDEHNSYLVPWRLGAVPEGSYILPPGSMWADPDLGAAAQVLRHVYEHPEEARAVGERARESIRRTHGLEAAARVARQRFEAIALLAPTPTPVPAGPPAREVANA